MKFNNDNNVLTIYLSGRIDANNAAEIEQSISAAIAENAGLEGAVILDKVKNSDDVNFGFNAATEEFGDMIESGVVDPTKVCRSALENAASVASVVLTTESLVADIPEPPAAAPANPDMGGMY